LGEFVKKLGEARVKTLLDVRSVAWSHKPGFSKAALKKAVEEAGIAYVHEAALGAPKKLRESLYATQDYGVFFKGYREHLNGLNGDLTRVARQASQGDTCLLCFESEATKCHRSVLAERLNVESGGTLQITHL